MAFLDIYGGSGGAETILTSKYSGSTSSVSKMVDFGPPGAEKLIFSDKTSACLNDCSPKLREGVRKKNPYFLWSFAKPPLGPGRSPKVHGPKVHKARARAFDYFECFRSLLAVLKFLEVLTMSLALVGATIDI